MKANDYDFEIEFKPGIDDDPSKEELEYINSFLPEIMREMVQIMSNDEE